MCRGASAAPASMTGAPIASSTPSVPRPPNAPCRARRARRGAERRARRARPREAAQREPPRAGAGGVARTRVARGESSTRPSPTQSSSGAATGATRRDSLEGERRTVTLATFGFVWARPSDAYSRMRGALNNRESDDRDCVSPPEKVFTMHGSPVTSCAPLMIRPVLFSRRGGSPCEERIFFGYLS